MTRGRRSIRAVGIMAVLSLVLSSCWVYTTATNKVVAGNIAYVYFRRIATDNVVDLLHYNVNHANPRATLSTMLAFGKSNLFKTRLKKIGFYLTDVDYFFDEDNDSDFYEAAGNVVGTNRCLVMHRNLNPWGDRHNWTYRDSNDKYCDRGKGFI